MAKANAESTFLKLATRMGLEQLKKDVDELLSGDLTQAQRIANEEMKTQILKHLEGLK